jgi:hypothetical protein
LALLILLAIATTSEGSICCLNPAAEDRTFYEEEIRGECRVVDIVGYGNWVAFVSGESCKLTPPTALLVLS